MKSLSLRIKEGIYVRLEKLARKRGASKSEIVRQALESYLSDRKKLPPGSFLAQARDLAGCVAGAPDLSVRAAHMEGYGK